LPAWRARPEKFLEVMSYSAVLEKELELALDAETAGSKGDGVVPFNVKEHLAHFITAVEQSDWDAVDSLAETARADSVVLGHLNE
jgi:hypothetical protein